MLIALIDIPADMDRGKKGLVREFQRQKIGIYMLVLLQFAKSETSKNLADFLDNFDSDSIQGRRIRTLIDVVVIDYRRLEKVLLISGLDPKGC